MAIELVTEQFPFVFTRFEGEQTASELDAYIKKMDAVHARRERYVGVTFIKSYTRDRKLVERVARWMKETEQVTRDYCMGVAMINDSIGFRFLLSAIFLIKAMPCPYQVCGTFDDAMAFLRAAASSAGLALPVARRPWADVP